MFLFWPTCLLSRGIAQGRTNFAHNFQHPGSYPQRVARSRESVPGPQNPRNRPAKRRCRAVTRDWDSFTILQQRKRMSEEISRSWNSPPPRGSGPPSWAGPPVTNKGQLRQPRRSSSSSRYATRKGRTRSLKQGRRSTSGKALPRAGRAKSRGRRWVFPALETGNPPLNPRQATFPLPPQWIGTSGVLCLSPFWMRHWPSCWGTRVPYSEHM